MKKLISIVIPAYNEEEMIPQLTKKLTSFMDSIHKYSFEVIIVDNGSHDRTMEELIKSRKKEKRIKIVQLAKNERADGGIIAGLHFVLGDAAVVMMADLQEPPEVIPQLIKKWEEGYDVVYGIVMKRKKVPLTRRINTFLYYKITTFLTRGMVIENASDFRLIDRKVYQTVISMQEHNAFFRGLIAWTGFRQIGIPFDRSPRAAGKSKAYLKDVIWVGLNGVFPYSNFFFYLPLVFSLIFFILIIIFVTVHANDLAFESFFSTCLLLTLAIILEYIRRIFSEVQNRPRFIVSEKIGL
ncbi:MAG TPA: glycosyltransferase family 2 protein [Patescibacteria group bacterium]|nr:glycosyltransferase family 2 protein [Patescibacteria group bacterium]